MTSDLSRRSFLGLTAALPFAAAAFVSAAKKLPVGLELYSVRDDLANQHLHCSLRHRCAFPLDGNRKRRSTAISPQTRGTLAIAPAQQCLHGRKVRIAAHWQAVVEVSLAGNIAVPKCLRMPA